MSEHTASVNSRVCPSFTAPAGPPARFYSPHRRNNTAFSVNIALAGARFPLDVFQWHRINESATDRVIIKVTKEGFGIMVLVKGG